MVNNCKGFKDIRFVESEEKGRFGCFGKEEDGIKKGLIIWRY